MPQESGYAILTKTKFLLSRYEMGYFSEQNVEPLRELRAAFSFLDLSAYKGISRDPLEAYPSTDENILLAFRETGVDIDTNQLARRRMRELQEENGISSDDLSNDHLLLTLDQANQVFELLDNKQEYEIVLVRRNTFGYTPSTLGYDIGYWGGDHFSLICDTVVMPLWHPPDPSDWAELAQEYKALNSHLLFSTVSDAQHFKKYYKSKPWAETETHGEFEIIQVDEVA